MSTLDQPGVSSFLFDRVEITGDNPYSKWSESSLAVANRLINRLYNYSAVNMPQYCTTEGKFDLSAITVEDAIRIINDVEAVNYDIRKQLMLTFCKVLKMLNVVDVLTHIDFVSTCDHISCEADKFRRKKVLEDTPADRKTWDDVIKRCDELIAEIVITRAVVRLNAIMNYKVIAMFLKHLPPLRSQDYVSIALVDNGHNNFLDLATGRYLIRDFKSRIAFAAKYGNSGTRTIDLPYELTEYLIWHVEQYPERNHLLMTHKLSTYTTSSFSTLMTNLFGVSTRAIRTIYASYIIPTKTPLERGRIAYIMGHCMNTQERDYIRDSGLEPAS